MRKLLLSSILLGATLPLPAQSAPSTPAISGWSRVQALTANTSLHISARTHNAHCRLKTVEADTLTCVVADGARTEVYQRSDIKSIKVPHRGRSTVVGLAIGGGAGIITGIASGGKGQLFTRGELASSFGIIFGAVGALIGALTDFTQTTVYRG